MGGAVLLRGEHFCYGRSRRQEQNLKCVFFFFFWRTVIPRTTELPCKASDERVSSLLERCAPSYAVYGEPYFRPISVSNPSCSKADTRGRAGKERGSGRGPGVSNALSFSSASSSSFPSFDVLESDEVALEESEEAGVCPHVGCGLGRLQSSSGFRTCFFCFFRWLEATVSWGCNFG